MGPAIRNVTLRQIEGFVLAADLLSFSRAAEKMSITQSAFSQMIRELEVSLGLRLFDRTTRRVHLTDSGAVMHRMMKRGVVEIASACDEARAIARVERGQIVVDTLPSLAIGLVTRACGDLRRSFPGIKINIREGDNGSLLKRVALNEADFAVCAESADAAGVSFTHLFEDELVVVMKDDHHFARYKRLRWSWLCNESFIMTMRGSSTNEQITDAFKANKINKPPEYEVGSMVTALSMVRAGFGMTFIPMLVLPDVSLEGLACLRVEGPSPTRRIGICRRAGRTASPAALKFEELLKAQVVLGEQKRDRSFREHSKLRLQAANRTIKRSR